MDTAHSVAGLGGGIDVRLFYAIGRYSTTSARRCTIAWVLLGAALPGVPFFDVRAAKSGYRHVSASLRLCQSPFFWPLIEAVTNAHNAALKSERPLAPIPLHAQLMSLFLFSQISLPPFSIPLSAILSRLRLL